MPLGGSGVRDLGTKLSPWATETAYTGSVVCFESLRGDILHTRLFRLIHGADDRKSRVPIFLPDIWFHNLTVRFLPVCKTITAIADSVSVIAPEIVKHKGRTYTVQKQRECSWYSTYRGVYNSGVAVEGWRNSFEILGYHWQALSARVKISFAL